MPEEVSEAQGESCRIRCVHSGFLTSLATEDGSYQQSTRLDQTLFASFSGYGYNLEKAQCRMEVDTRGTLGFHDMYQNVFCLYGRLAEPLLESRKSETLSS